MFMETDDLMQHVVRFTGSSTARTVRVVLKQWLRWQRHRLQKYENGQVDTVQFKQSRHLAITVYFGQRSGSASTHDFRAETIQQAVHTRCLRCRTLYQRRPRRRFSRCRIDGERYSRSATVSPKCLDRRHKSIALAGKNRSRCIFAHDKLVLFMRKALNLQIILALVFMVIHTVF
jgi:hypothetical protein